MPERIIAVVGLGYVGLPLALAFARKFPGTLGFDVDAQRVRMLQERRDPTGEGFEAELKKTSVKFLSDSEKLRQATLFVVAVPTPVDQHRVPDLSPLAEASRLVGSVLKRGDVVVYESTVNPGVTEEFCGSILAQASELRQGTDFKIGYSPERIVPGDPDHTLEKIVKVVSAEDAQTLSELAAIYGAIVPAGIHQAPSIKVAEACKVIENTQRDLNIALINELAMICDRLGIRTADVLAAARSKWNFLPFSPGLVGGHCIGVDPYYLTTKAEQIGYHPEVILAGRRLNEEMGRYVARRFVKLLINAGINPQGARVGVLGVTFKEDVADVRNSRVPDILTELAEFGVRALLHDPLAVPAAVREQHELELCALEELRELDGLILAVTHRFYLERLPQLIVERVKAGGVVADVKSVIDPASLPHSLHYWSL